MVVRHSGLAKMILKLLCTETMLWSTDEKMWDRLSHETSQGHGRLRWKQKDLQEAL